MINLELPLGKRTKLYRLFEVIPAAISYGMILLYIVLSLTWPLGAAIYLLLLIITLFVKSIGIAFHTIRGHNYLTRAQRVDWHGRLMDLEDPKVAHLNVNEQGRNDFGRDAHAQNVRLLAAEVGGDRPKPAQLYHAVIIAAYNESYDVIQPTIESVRNSTYDSSKIIIYIAYEQRGGPQIAATAKRLQKEYRGVFYTFQIVMHPDGLDNEVVGKGPNITFAGHALQKWCDSLGMRYSDVIVTTLDSDNRPHPTYFDYVAYEYIAQDDRKHLSYQPIALYFGNIWDAPAPMRVIATGNSFWTIISSMRPHTLRNFAAHSQPLDALVEMNFWSKLSIVEDGHQYWRSYFYFGGNYSVLPIHVPIYQDAVMADTLKKTLVAQFKQLRRWGYGVSDIPYVATRIFTKKRNVPFWEGLARFIRLVDSHITLATMAIMIAFGGWVPLLVNPASSRSIAAHSLPVVVSYVQQVAMIGLFITILLMLKMLPPRPERYKRHRTVFMVLQWFLMPFTSVFYSSLASFNAQTHLALGKYLDTFDVTEKATLASQEKARQQKRKKHAKKA
ncbi:glycosyltransferase family 2 protein [Candidatus Saccharibacteria bacterium]|nr:glycosyltransferase family 2 protein [Candidatus Saccharibacteria bacterium]